MTPTREELLAQRAEIDAKLAALDAQPDWICSGIPDEAVEAGIAAWDKAKHDLENYTSGETADWDEGMIVCAIYKAMAPLAPAPTPMGEDEIEALASKIAQDGSLWASQRDLVRLAIRETLRRVPAWPGEFLADGEALLIAFAEGTNWTPEKRAAYSRFASVIRRLKARMGAGGGAKIEPYIVYADDEGWFDWHGGECPVPAETRVEYKLRYGAVRAAKAWQLVWGHCANPSAYDIVAYRIIPGEEA